MALTWQEAGPPAWCSAPPASLRIQGSGADLPRCLLSGLFCCPHSFPCPPELSSLLPPWPQSLGSFLSIFQNSWFPLDTNNTCLQHGAQSQVKLCWPRWSPVSTLPLGLRPTWPLSRAPGLPPCLESSPTPRLSFQAVFKFLKAQDGLVKGLEVDRSRTQSQSVSYPALGRSASPQQLPWHGATPPTSGVGEKLLRDAHIKHLPKEVHTNEHPFASLQKGLLGHPYQDLGLGQVLQRKIYLSRASRFTALWERQMAVHTPEAWSVGQT